MPIEPSTQWREVVAADEDQRYAEYARIFADIQARKNKRYGAGRALHRKGQGVARAELTVLPHLPAFAQQGLFAQAGRYHSVLRLSNGGMDRASDKTPDIRGLAISVRGVQALSAQSALGNGPPKQQDFLLINQEQFAFQTSDEFVHFVAAAAVSPGRMLGHFFKRYGPVGGAKQLAKLIKTMGKPFTGFANASLFSAVPMACGPYAVRVRLVPDAANGEPKPDARADWAGDFANRLRQQPLSWQLQLQPFVDEATTPIEDASVNWPTPYTTVATLKCPQQDMADAAGKALAEGVENGVIDPWQALAEHRPLGDVQRARKVVYFGSQQGRGAVG